MATLRSYSRCNCQTYCSSILILSIRQLQSSLREDLSLPLLKKFDVVLILIDLELYTLARARIAPTVTTYLELLQHVKRVLTPLPTAPTARTRV